MGRPEKPPSSAYSLFSKEMLNTEAIKQFPSKERMSHISESWKRVSEADKEIYQTKVNEAMSKYKSEYNDWFESLSLEEQKLEKERTSQKSGKKSSAATIPLATATNTIIAGATGANVAGSAVQLPQQPIYTQLPTNLQPLPPQPQQLQNLQMPITVPYPNMTGAGAAQPMLVKVEVVGAPGTQSHVTHAQLMPQTMTYNVAGTTYNPGQVSYATQPFSMQVAPQPQVQPAPMAAQVTQPAPAAMTHVTPAPSTTVTAIPAAAPVSVKPETGTVRVDGLRSEILRREPVEPARSPKQLFLSDYVKKQRRKDKKSTDQKLQSDAKEIWRVTDKKDKKKWLKMLEPQRQKYIEAYTIFVRGLNKEELELYTEMKARRDAEDEAKRAVESSDEEESDTSDDESDTDSESGSDSDI